MKENNTNPSGLKAKVKKPEAMVNHKQTKQFKDEGKNVEKAKTVTKEKMTRAQMVEKFQVDIAKVAGENPKGARTAQRYYEAMFQIADTKEFMNLVQKVDIENKSIVLKTGFSLPIIPEESVINFMDFFVTITNAENAPVINIVKSKLEETAGDEATVLFTYALFELLARGRKAHQIDWNEVEAVGGFNLEDDGVYTRVYLAMDEFSENPEENAGIIKGLLLELNEDAFNVFSQLFSRDSLKKLGIVVQAPLYNGENLIDAGVAEFISNIMFDTFGDYTPETDEEDEDEEEPEVEESPAKKSKTSPENTQKQKVEETGGEDEDEADDIVDEDEADIFDDEDGEDESWDEEDEDEE